MSCVLPLEGRLHFNRQIYNIWTVMLVLCGHLVAIDFLHYISLYIIEILGKCILISRRKIKSTLQHSNCNVINMWSLSCHGFFHTCVSIYLRSLESVLWSPDGRLHQICNIQTVMLLPCGLLVVMDFFSCVSLLMWCSIRSLYIFEVLG